MKLLIVWACADRFSYEDFHLHRYISEGDYSVRDLESMRNEYLKSFQNKRISKLSLVYMDVSPEGVVTVIDNVQGVNELAVRKEINPAAVAAKEARKVKSVKVIHDYFLDTPVMQDVVTDV